MILVGVVSAGACLALATVCLRLRRQLDSSREAFDRLAQRAPVGILRADAAGMCTFANDTWSEISGLTLAETLGHGWGGAVHPDDLPGVMAKWQESVRTGGRYVNELRLVRPDGVVRYVMAGSAPVRDDGGRPGGFIGTVLDVTEYRQARLALEDREQLLRSLLDVQEQEKQLLCHEFHDGLIQYAVASKMVLEGLRETGLPEPAVAAVDSVIDCLAKGIEDGRRVIRGIRPAALDDLGLRAALEELAVDLRDAGIDVQAEFAAAIDAVSRPLQTTIYRVVQESLNNVRRHSGSDRVDVSVRRSGERIELSVIDRGRGFDPATINGFGLIGMRERVRLLGGECRIETTLGGGTKVFVSLPAPPAG